MNELTFIKMHCLGNDFLLLDCINKPLALTKSQIIALGNRRLGVGYDQLLMLSAGQVADEIVYQIWNADGIEVGQCGNGARCAFLYLKTREYCQQSCRLVTPTSSIEVCQGETGPRVTLGCPEFEPEKIPIKAERQQQYEVDWGGKKLQFACLSIGNPHAILLVDDVSQAQVDSIGSYLNEASELFPERVNVSFLAQLNATEFNLRVYERGVGETPACGSAAAACAATIRLLLAVKQPIKINLPGGQLLAHWPDETSEVWIEGKATETFTGEINLTDLISNIK